MFTFSKGLVFPDTFFFIYVLMFRVHATFGPTLITDLKALIKGLTVVMRQDVGYRTTQLQTDIRDKPERF